MIVLRNPVRIDMYRGEMARLCECPLRVISGHVWLLKNASALPLKADILGAGQRCPLSAKSGHIEK